MKVSFKTDFKDWCDKNRWTPSTLAEKLGVQRQSVHNWISASSLPKNAEVITRLFALGGDELLAFENASDRPNVPKKHQFFEVEGGHRLEGEIRISGAKNAALPMLSASLLTSEKCLFHDVPDISDIDVLLDIFKILGVEVARDRSKRTVEIQAKTIDPTKLKNCPLAQKMRASILMLGPLLARFGEVDIPLPGGCVLGARPNSAHLDAFASLGCVVDSDDQHIHLNFERKTFLAKRVLFSEASVTATENLALFCAGVPDEAELFFTAAEAHVVATTKMLQKMGAKIEGVGTHSLKIRGAKKLKGGSFVIPPDGLLVGTYAIASVLTGGDLLIKNVDHRELFSFYGLFERAGAQFEILSDSLRVLPSPVLRAIPKLQTAIFPGFSTDLQSPFGVLLTQCEGESLVFETLFENRLTYLSELEKMGAKVQVLNPHQAKIIGKTELHGAAVQSWDLRAGAAMVLAGLVAEGTTRISNVNYIDRGYENFSENLVELGAKIVRSDSSFF